MDQRVHAVQSINNDKWTVETVLSVRRWTANLFSLQITRPQGFRFLPGQFARLGLPLTADLQGPIVWRAYSMASANYDEHLEFYSIVVPGGEFTSRLEQLGPGDALLVEKASFGFLTTNNFVGGRDLWLLASGTGLAPFLSILHDPQVWESFDNLVLVHSVRQKTELVYQEEISALNTHPLLADSHACLHYLPVVTRELVPGALHARMTQLLMDGQLESASGFELDTEHSRLMVCGNPQMAADLRKLLMARGFRVGRRGIPGQLAFENYW